MRQSRVLHGEHGISYLVIALKEAEIKSEAIPVHMHHKQTATKQLKDKGETHTVMVHAVQIKKPKNYLYALMKSGGRLHCRTMISDTLNGFYLV